MNEKIKEMEAQIADLRNEMRHEKQRATAFEGGKEMGVQISATLAGLIDGGLDEDFAKTVIIEGIKAGVK